MKPRTVLVAVSLLAVVGLALGAQAVPASSAAYLSSIRNTANTTATAPYFTCAGATNATAERAAAYFVYPLNETFTLLGANDQSGHLFNNGAYSGGFATSTATPIACPRDTGGAYVLNGSSSFVTSPSQVTNPQTFSVEVWFKTTVASGKLIGLGSSQTGLSPNYDRHIYFTTAGKLNFGVNGTAGVSVITSPLSYNDGLWHHAVATLSGAGAVLYVDGQSVIANPALTSAQVFNGYWRIGYDQQTGWPNPGANAYFTGQMRWAAAYNVALTPAQVTAHYLAGR